MSNPSSTSVTCPTATLSLLDFLSLTAAWIRLRGWISKTQAYESDNAITPTATLVARDFQTPSDQRQASVQPADVTLARAAIEWLRSLEDSAHPLGDYHLKLAQLPHEPLTESFYGLAASVIPAYQRWQERDSRVSAHFGEVGERDTFELTVTAIREFEGTYGPVHLHRFIDPEGNVATWFSSRARLDVGLTYRLKSTIKAHDIYRGVPQTLLTRCTVVEDLHEAA